MIKSILFCMVVLSQVFSYAITYREINPGTVVHCKLAGILDHTGIYIGNNRIIHRDGDGFLAEVSPTEFVQRLNDTFGVRTINVVSDSKGNVICKPMAAERARRALVNARLRNGYSLIYNNCHQFCFYCWTGEKDTECWATTFTSLQLSISLTDSELDDLVRGLKVSRSVRKASRYMFGGLLGLMTDSKPSENTAFSTCIAAKFITSFRDRPVLLRWMDVD